MSSRPAIALLLVVTGALVFCGDASALPPAPGVQAGRPVSVGVSAPKAKDASFLCEVGTPVIGGVLVKGACEAGEKLAGGLANEAISAAGSGVMDSLSEWMIGAARSITGFVAKEMQASTTPQLGAAWYRSEFASQADLGAALGLLVSLIALSSAAIRRDPHALAGTLTGIVRAGIGTGLVLALTMLALEIADQISAAVLTAAPHSFWSTVSHAWGTSGVAGFESSALAMLIALIEVLCGLGVWLELIVRDAATYVAVLFFPVVLAASIWPALSAWTGRLARILQLLVSMKPVAVIVLSLAGNAAAAGLSFGGDVSGSVGTILAAIVIFALAAFAPWALMYLISAEAESAHATMGMRAAAGGALAGSQARSLRKFGGLRNNSGRGQGGGRPPAGGAGHPGPPSGGDGPGGSGGGAAPQPGGSSGGAGELAGDDALPLAGAAVGGGSVGAAAGAAAHATRVMAGRASLPAEITDSRQETAGSGRGDQVQQQQPATVGADAGVAAPAMPSPQTGQHASAIGSPDPPHTGQVSSLEHAGSAPSGQAPASAEPAGEPVAPSGTGSEQGAMVVRLPPARAAGRSRRDPRAGRPVTPSRPRTPARQPREEPDG